MGIRDRIVVTFAFAFALVTAGASTAHAQGGSWGDLAVSAVRIDYDLSGVGSAPGLAVRTTRDVFSNVRLEFGGTLAKPDQQFGTSTLFLPEAQLQYRWRAGRISPYLGGGIGAALVKSDFHTDWDPTLSVALGTGVQLADRWGLTGEVRLRGHEWRFTGTTAELSVGVTWRLAAF
jgi:hypothetical protein